MTNLKKDFQKSLKVTLPLIGALIFGSCAPQGSFNVDKTSTESPANPSPQAEDLSEVQNYIVVLKQRPILAQAALAAQAEASGLNGEAQSRAMAVQAAAAQAIVASSLSKLESDFQLEAASLTFSAAIHGGVFKMDGHRAKAMAKNENVAYVENDQIMYASTLQTNVTWGLDRIDQSALPLDRNYNYGASGAGVTAYVIDTGILNTHNEFQGRASSGKDFVDNDNDSTDCNGHGTHVAGTIGGKTFGVAKNVKLVGVRVLSCEGSGSNAGVIAGVDWVTANHKGPSVANMSLGGGISQALEDAIANSIRSGVTYAIAAGNDNKSACLSSPARMKDGIKVGSTTSGDARSSFSNFGECVDIFAPGTDIQSAWDTSNSATQTISGTSMATPHTAGVIALYLEKNGSATPVQVKAALIAGSVSGKVTSAGTGSPNRLLNVAFVNAALPPPPADESVLKNGVASAAVSGAKDAEKVFTITVPSGAKNLSIEMSGGVPDADLYVKLGSKPSTAAYDCRPYTATNNETCSFASPVAGVYYVTVRGYTAFSGVVVKARFTP